MLPFLKYFYPIPESWKLIKNSVNIFDKESVNLAMGLNIECIGVIGILSDKCNTKPIDEAPLIIV